MKNYLNNHQPFRFVFPIEGDCVNLYDGISLKNGLEITAAVSSKNATDTIYINDDKAQFQDGCFTAPVLLDGYRNTLFAENRTTGEHIHITVYRLQEPVLKYRLSSDDNILFLADINDHKEEYTSVFDNPYLALYKKAHDLYGAKVHLNLFYSFDKTAAARFSRPRAYFDLSMMTDKFRDEFIANSNWLKFSFHANAEFPDNPYRNASFYEIDADIKRTHREIVRFAGKQTLSDVCTVHWGQASPAAIQALRQNGYCCLAGYFEIHNGCTRVAYHYPLDLVAHVGGRDFWKDTGEDMFFARIDTVLNSYSASQVIPTLKDIHSDPHRRGFMSIMIHEQYFYQDYQSYLPDFSDIVLTACKWLNERHYTGQFISDTIRE